MRSLLLALACALAFMLALPPLHARAENAYVVGVEKVPYLPHYAWAEGQYTGFARELFDAFAADQSYALTFEALPVKRLSHTFFVQKSLDCKYPDNPNWVRGLRMGVDVHYSDPVVEYIDGVMVLPENKGKKHELQTLGTVLGFTPWDFLSDIEKGDVQLSENTSLQSLLHMTAKGRLDGSYVNVSVAKERLREMGLVNALVFDDSLPHTRDSYYLSSIDHPAVIEDFNSWMQENADTVVHLKKKWRVFLED